MPDSEKQTKVKVYKLAKELNLSHETLLDFLHKKGFEIKSYMSVLEPEAIDIIFKHFKKEKVDAERHARKRKEYDELDRKRRGEEKHEEGLESVEAEQPVTFEELPEQVAEIEPEEVPPAEEVSEVVAVEEEPVVVEDIQPPEPVIEVEPEPVVVSEEVPPVKEVVQVEEPAAVEAELPPVETPVEEPVSVPADKPAAQPPVAEKETVEEEKPARGRKKREVRDIDLSLEAAIPKMGLKVKGKIEVLPAEPGADSKRTEESDDAAKAKHKKKKKKHVPGTEPKTETPGEKVDLEPLKKKLLKKAKKSPKARTVDDTEVADAIRRTIASMGEVGPVSNRASFRKKKRAKKQEENLREIERSEKELKVIKIYEYATVSELAGLMNVNVGAVISSLISMGVMASINQRLDLDTITLVASEFGFEVQKNEEVTFEQLEDTDDDDTSMTTRPPIVTIMGHVDHGKTSLLDYIRNANVVAGESGGITQHIGAYTVQLDSGRRITFLDTPGHEAFTAMRARGAQVTDIVVLVVAADDNVMPQTVEAISHSLAAKVPIIVAINKIDKPSANPEHIKQQLAEHNILVEDWSGKYGCIELSAKVGTNVNQLLDRILLEADILELKANPDRLARGVVLESRLDKQRGPVATVLVQKGTLRIGDAFVAGKEFGKVRALLDEREKKVDDAGPSISVQVLGFNGIPQAGDSFIITETEREAREAATVRQQISREFDFKRVHRPTLDDISEQIKLGGVRELSLIVKADVDGSIGALTDSLMRLSTSEVKIGILHSGTGTISESDVLLASASQAIIIGFRVRPNLNARRLAETESVDIRSYEIIYDAINDVKSALEGLLRPEISERVLATILVRDVFKISQIGTIAGCYVQDGKIKRQDKVRLLRDGVIIFNGSIDSLKRFKDDVREVDTNFECGISLAGFNDVKIGDVIEAYERVETKRTLASVG
jgi:translation initiation factor IF-2